MYFGSLYFGDAQKKHYFGEYYFGGGVALAVEELTGKGSPGSGRKYLSYETDHYEYEVARQRELLRRVKQDDRDFFDLLMMTLRTLN